MAGKIAFMSNHAASAAVRAEPDTGAEGGAVTEASGSEAPPKRQARTTLTRRLADVVCLPESRINAFERAVTSDLLVEMLAAADLAERVRAARRISILSEPPWSLVRLLIVDAPEAARCLIEDCEALSDADLHYCVKHGEEAHHLLLAARKDLPPLIAESLVESGGPAVIEILLKNMRARLSQPAIEAVAALSQAHTHLIPLLLKRSELRPSSAYVVFWWANAECRRIILTRFAVNREIMQDMASDVFAMMAKEKWQDPLARKALQFIERRQRNREAVAKSPYDSLEAAIAEAAKTGMTRTLAEEIAYMAGLKPATGAKLMRDAGGEGLAVMCKATGLSRKALRALWKALRRPMRDEDGKTHPDLANVLVTYDIMATDRAQTVLRYWNWSLSSALTHAMLRAIASGVDVDYESLSVPERAAMLAFAQDLKS